ncbi:MAG: ankyrin repeat domain-containing protein [Alphaproteobacteria bacterium]|nr:ankyrin repeat domain-containing protein [Alphaproteobacteria bacterium]
MKKALLLAFLVLFATRADASVEQLIEGIKQNNLSSVMNLIKQGENVNAANEQGNTPLHYAVATNNAKMIEVLLANGADIYATNAKGWTPLKIAKQKNVPEILPILQNAERKLKLQEVAQRNKGFRKTATKNVQATADKAKEITNKVEQTTAQSQAITMAEKAQYRELIERAKQGILAARQAQEKTLARNKELETEIAQLLAANKALEQRLQANEKSEAKQVKKEPKQPSLSAQKKSNTVATPKVASTKNTQTVTTKSNPVKSMTSKVNIMSGKNKSVLNPQISAGSEEIVYCLHFLGHGDNKTMYNAAGYYAASAGIGETRYRQIVALSDKFFTSSAADNLKKRSDECSKIITPSNADRQNMIIRSINRAIGH